MREVTINFWVAHTRTRKVTAEKSLFTDQFDHFWNTDRGIGITWSRKGSTLTPEFFTKTLFASPEHEFNTRAVLNRAEHVKNAPFDIKTLSFFVKNWARVVLIRAGTTGSDKVFDNTRARTCVCTDEHQHRNKLQPYHNQKPRPQGSERTETHLLV